MRLHRRAPIAHGLSLAAVAALTLLAEPATAQFRGGMSPTIGPRITVAPRATVMPRTVTPRAVTTPSAVAVPRGTTMPSGVVMPRATPMPRITGVSRTPQMAIANPTYPGKGRKPPRKPPGPVVGDKTPEPGAGGTKPPRNPDGRPPRRPRPPVWVGPAVGTGVLIGTVGPVIADPPPPPPPGGRGGPGGPASGTAAINIPPANEQRFVPNEVVLEFATSLSPQAVSALTRRHRLARLDSINVASTDSTYLRARILDGRPVRTVLARLRSEVSLRAGQPNYIYVSSQAAEARATFTPPASATPQATPAAAAAGPLPALGDPAQYALAKLRLQEAHGLTRGSNVLVAVIDSGVDASHPELRGVIASTFDALGKAEKPHLHGTAIAGTIAARSRLMGVAPAARILAIRAFGATGNSAQATTFAILKGIDHALSRNARVINMSFAGPLDPGLARQYAAARARGVVLVAAAGNLGASSPPQYPAADPNVIAVSATDAEDNLFKASNRGEHIAVAAPGVDILVPAPNANYELTSGTSFAAAYVSGIVALILERKPGLDPEEIRKVLIATAKDLGPSGKDNQFGAGLADAYRAILALEPRNVAAPEQAPEPVASAQ